MDAPDFMRGDRRSPPYRLMHPVMMLVVLFAQFPCPAFSAERTTTPLPIAVFADGEASTHVPLPAFTDGASLKTTLRFDATSSNFVQVAIGRDVDHDGFLSLLETALFVGWNSGEWFVRRRGESGWDRLAQPDTAGFRAFSVIRRTRGTAPDQTLSILLDDEPLALSGFEDWLPLAALDDPALVRITIRGAGCSGMAFIGSEADAKILVLR